jgi:hypothetical protein
MDKEQTIAALELNIKEAQKELDYHKGALEDFRASPECNVFDNLEDAEDAITEELEALAREDCEGAYNYGNDLYSRKFSVGGKAYEATMTFEYNRHDKTYYYIEESEYSYKEII